MLKINKDIFVNKITAHHKIHYLDDKVFTEHIYVCAMNISKFGVFAIINSIDTSVLSELNNYNRKFTADVENYEFSILFYVI